MSSEHRHRGKHPADDKLFAAGVVPALQRATSDLCWLLTQGYARTSALKLVGDRHLLTERQRLAVGRAACSEADRERRRKSELSADQLRGRDVAIDGFNLLVSLEAALSGGVLLRCHDGCIRDMSGVHGSYHAIAETKVAFDAVAGRLDKLGVRSARWLLDKPVSNSGRLARHLRAFAAEHRWPWTVEVVLNPDAELMAGTEVVISADGRVLDHAASWFNLSADLLDRIGWPRLCLVDLRG